MTTTTAPCPVCNGTGTRPQSGPCQNCGGQTMEGRATGQVRVRPEGTPCTHDYRGREAGRLLTRFTCEHCGDSFSIDSSD